MIAAKGMAMGEQRQDATRGWLGSVWGPAGALHALCCLAGLAAGLWPGTIHPSGFDTRSAVLPTLRTVAVAQIAFFWLVYPLVLLRRRVRPGISPGWRAVVVEPPVILLTAIPFYVMAAALGNATLWDVLRVALYVASGWPVVWAAWMWLRLPSARTPVMLAMALVVLAGPAVAYMLLEFVTSGYRAVFNAAGVLRAWSLGGRSETLVTRPYWTWLLWPTVGLLAMLAGIARSRRGTEETPPFRPGRE
jgi:hypothetical protein